MSDLVCSVRSCGVQTKEETLWRCASCGLVASLTGARITGVDESCRTCLHCDADDPEPVEFVPAAELGRLHEALDQARVEKHMLAAERNSLRSALSAGRSGS